MAELEKAFRVALVIALVGLILWAGLGLVRKYAPKLGHAAGSLQEKV